MKGVAAIPRGLSVLLFAALLTTPVLATTHTVGPFPNPGSCSVAPSGTCAHEFCSVTAALASGSVVSGDTVIVLPGTYFENVLMKNGVRLLGSGPEVTILDGCQLNSVVRFPVNGNAYTILSGFTIRNGRSTEGAGVNIADPNLAAKDLGRQTITRNVITGNTAVAAPCPPPLSGSCGGVGGGISVYKQNSKVTNNLIRGNTAHQFGGGLAVGFSDAVVTNNTIHGNTVTGASFNEGGGIDMYTVEDEPILSNNIVQGNSAANGGGIFRYQQSGYTSTVTLRNSNIFSNGTNCVGVTCTGSGNLSVDSAFVSSGTGNFQLQGGSPMRDAGNNADIPAEGVDLPGETRILDGNGNGTAETDIGCYEYCLNDPDGDGFNNCVDNCAALSNGSQSDGDADGVGDGCDNCPVLANPPATPSTPQADADSDTVGDACDNCPSAANQTQQDTDADGDGNACDNCPSIANGSQSDGDADTVGDVCDNCPAAANTTQTDQDSDTVGNACDNCVALANTTQTDSDTDTVGDVCDNCPLVSNPSQSFTDADSDGRNDLCDNCPGLSNPSQADPDADGRGTGCDNCPAAANANQADGDGDTIGTVCDNCPVLANTNQADGDLDGVGTVCDNCPVNANSGQQNSDADSAGDACDTCTDSDADGFGNPGLPATVCPLDNCPAIANANQADSDTDQVGNVCDNCVSVANPGQEDPDGDLRGSACDNCPSVANSSQTDGDLDGVGNVCDNCVSAANPLQEDPDADLHGSACDNCATVANPGQENADGDSLGDLCDSNDDNDLVLDDGNGDGQIEMTVCQGTTVNCDDCAHLDAANWSIPGEVLNVRWTSTTVLAWDSVGSGTAPLYNILRGKLSELHTQQSIGSAICLQKDWATLSRSVTLAPSPGGDGHYYILGAENGCRNFPTWGFANPTGPATTGAERLNNACTF